MAKRKGMSGGGMPVNMVPAAAPTDPGSYTHPMSRLGGKNEYAAIASMVQPQMERSGGHSGGIPTGGTGSTQSPVAPRGR